MKPFLDIKRIYGLVQGNLIKFGISTKILGGIQQCSRFDIRGVPINIWGESWILYLKRLMKSVLSYFNGTETGIEKGGRDLKRESTNSTQSQLARCHSAALLLLSFVHHPYTA